MSGERGMRALLEDGSLAIDAAPELRPWIDPWLPRVPVAPAPQPAAVLHVNPGRPDVAHPGRTPDMELWKVGGWVLAGEVVIADQAGRIGGRVELDARRARVCVDLASGGPGIVEVSSALTVAAALLVGRLGRALVHAGAVIRPGGGAWLLAGGSFSGKTTTCLNLIRSGWDWLADDHVVLSAQGDGVRVEGWPRRFNLDEGFAGGASTGTRSRVDPEGFGPGRWRRAAQLEGLLFPRVEADRPTERLPLHPAGALGALVRHAPWLLADAGAAGAVLAVLKRAARHPAFDLRLGRDTYCDAGRLQLALSGEISPAVRPTTG